MARAPEDIANAALAYLVRDQIRTLDGTGPMEVQTKANLQAAIEEVIEEYDWWQCRVIAPLQAVTAIGTRGWTSAFAVPTDMVKLWFIGDNTQKNTTSIPFELGMSEDLSNDRNYIFTDQATPYIRYGSRRVSLDRWSAQQADLIAIALAIKCCMPLTKNEKLQASLRQEYRMRLNKVMTSAANAEPEVVNFDWTPETISVRSE